MDFKVYDTALPARGAGPRRTSLTGRAAETLTRLRRGVAMRLEPLTRSDIAAEARREELNLLAVRIPLYAFVSTSALAMLAVDLWSKLTAVSMAIGVLIPGLYVALHWQASRWKKGGGSRVYLRNSVLLLATISTCWSAVLTLLMPWAQSYKSDLIIGVAVALVSSPMATAPLSAAIAFWLPSLIGGAVVIAEAETRLDPAMMLSYLVYGGFTCMAAVLLNRSMLERAIGRIMLEKQNQTIAMFLRDYTENASDWLWETDQQLLLRHVSPRLAEVSGRPAGSLEGVSVTALVRAGPGCAGAATICKLMVERSAFRNVTVPVEIGGEARWWSMTGRPIIGEGGLFEGYRGIGSDITEVRRSEQRVQYLAAHDSLTGLANRQFFLDRLEDACARSAHAPQETALGAPHTVTAVLILDLDRFKTINDSFGHAVGDTLLAAVAARLRGCVRRETVVARLGGDEFGVILVVPDAPSALSVCQRIIDTLSIDYPLAGSGQSVGVSIGASFLESAQADCAYWLRCADLALYAAKAAGRGVFRVFSPDMIAEHDDRLSLQADLKSAIVAGELKLAYQPIFDTGSGAIVCVEALCRWEHPSLGPIPPPRFIRLAEESGLIVQLGAWALNEACQAASAWPDRVRIAVNVSPLQIRDGDFNSIVGAALARSGLAAERLELELTEFAYLEATDRTLVTLENLRKTGIRIVLDDFGTGYSALSYLASFKCDGVKIDASFVHEVEKNATKAAVVRAIGQLAADLAIPVTAEGVETREQLVAVRQLAIVQAQGYLLQRPASEDVIATLIVREPLRQRQAASAP